MAEGLIRDYESELPSAVAYFNDDFEACIARLRMPVNHRRAIHTTDEIDKRFLSGGDIVPRRGRPRGEARRIG